MSEEFKEKVDLKQKIFYNRSTNGAIFEKCSEYLLNPPSLQCNSNN